MITVDAAGRTDGSSFLETVTSGAVKVDVARIGSTEYLRLNKAAFTDGAIFGFDLDSVSSHTATALSKYAGTWVASRAPAEDRQINPVGRSIRELVGEEELPASTVAALVVHPVVDEGEPAYQLIHDQTKIVVSSDGSATLRFVDITGDGQNQTLRFSDWNAVPALQAPANAVPGTRIPGWHAFTSEGTSVSAGSDESGEVSAG